MAAVGAHDDRLSILVTHASTYLGRRICRLLSESYGFHVYAIDSSPVQAVEPHYDDCSTVAETAYRASVAAAAAAASTPSSQKRAPPPAPAANGAHTVRRPKCNAPGAGNITRLVGDVRKVEDACAAVSGMHAVVHVAVLGGADGVANGALKQNACHSAHSSAFTNLTRACIVEDVGTLVVISHAAAGHDAETGATGAEAAGWTPARKGIVFGDAFCRSVHALERDAISANGSCVGVGGQRPLLSVVLRPGRVYGEGEALTGAIVSAASRARRGWWPALVPCGSPKVCANWIHADNAAHAAASAVCTLVDSGRVGEERVHSHNPDKWPSCAGRIYHVSDGSAVNSYAFTASVLEAAGYDGIYEERDHWPALCAIAIAYVCTYSHLLLGTKFGCTVPQAKRWCEATTSSPSNAAALRDLGYMPVVDVHAAVARTACGLLRRNFGPLPGTALRARRRRAALRGLVAVLLALFAAILVYYMQMLMWWSFGGHKSASSSSSEEGAAAQLSGGYVLERERMMEELRRADWPSSEFEGNVDDINDADTLGGSGGAVPDVRWKNVEE